MNSDYAYGKFPASRPRRMRRTPALRRLVRENFFSLDQLVMPYFVRHGEGVKEEISAMPGQFRFSPDTLIQEIEELMEAGIRAVLLFGLPETKDESGSEAWSKNGIMQKTLRRIAKEFPELLVITDLCLCAYTKHGHCGVLTSSGEVDNDATLKLLASAAFAQAEAGSGMIAPSDMMDGRIHAIREMLDSKGFNDLPVMSYAAKFASAFYGPFREAAHSSPESGDRKSYQMDPPNLTEAMREIGMDIEEGADMVMVKPGLAYLDVIREAARTFNFPLAAYSVSGEYAMIKAAAERSLIDERLVVEETMTAFARAGARVMITYHAKQIGLWKNFEKKSQLVSK